jgi:hypothetical protein
MAIKYTNAINNYFSYNGYPVSTYPNTVTTNAITTTVVDTGTWTVPDGNYMTPSGYDTAAGNTFTLPNITVAPNIISNGQYFTFPPNLDALQEGVFDIKGGKIIIKKIMVTQEQIDDSDEEEDNVLEGKIIEDETSSQELEYLCASEEREI